REPVAEGGSASRARRRRAHAVARGTGDRGARGRGQNGRPARDGVRMAYEAVIGLECNIQMRTRTKMFCECPAEFGASANSNVCPVCLGLPGALPVTNRAAIDFALRLGLSLGWQIRA